MLKRKKGITLIALVITIIVLLILVGVSITTLVGESGILSKAKDAKENVKIEDEFEKVRLAVASSIVNEEFKVNEEDLEIELDNYFGKNNYKLTGGIDIGYYLIQLNKSEKQFQVNFDGNVVEKNPQFDYIIKEINESGMAVEVICNVIIEDLENLIEQEMNGEINFDETAREIFNKQAGIEGKSYDEILKDMLIQSGYTVSDELTTTDLENLVVEKNLLGSNLTFDNTLRDSFKKQAEEEKISYKEFLEGFVQDEEVLAKFNNLNLEIKFENEIISTANLEFIATKNGIYAVKLVIYDGQEIEGKISISGIKEEKFSKIYTETKEYIDKNGEKAIIPEGFAVGISKNISLIEDGLVITDAVDSEGRSIGNEFVWIPVSSEDDLQRVIFNNGKIYQVINNSYYEPCSKGYSDGNGTEETEDFRKMKEQVLKYNGFYIGRYEAGDATITNRLRSSSESVDEVVVRRGVAPYNFVKWGDSQEDIGEEGAVYLSKNMYKDSTSVTSTLIYGCQWDAMCRYIDDNNRKGEKTNHCNLTGRLGKDISKNIYDLAGNCSEWTMEAGGNYDRVIRSGDYKELAGIANRILFVEMAGWNPDIVLEKIAFRPSLYIINGPLD